MAETEENRRAVEAARQEYEQFVQEQDRDHQSTISCLRVTPAEMQGRLEGKHRELLKCYQGRLLGEAPPKQAALEGLQQRLDGQMAWFLSAYGQRYKVKKAEGWGACIGGTSLAWWAQWLGYALA